MSGNQDNLEESLFFKIVIKEINKILEIMKIEIGDNFKLVTKLESL